MTDLDPKQTMNSTLTSPDEDKPSAPTHPPVFEGTKRDPGAEGIGGRIVKTVVDPYHDHQASAAPVEQLVPYVGDVDDADYGTD